MKCKIRKILLVVSGVLIAAGWGLAGGPSSSDKKSTGKRLEFKIVLLGDNVDTEATAAGFRTRYDSDTHFGITEFWASDGQTLFSQGGEFRSREEAKRYFDWELAKCSKILTRGVKNDLKGKPIGYRAEVILPRDHERPAVMWTDGADFRQVICESLADARELERRYGH